MASAPSPAPGAEEAPDAESFEVDPFETLASLFALLRSCFPFPSVEEEAAAAGSLIFKGRHGNARVDVKRCNGSVDRDKEQTDKSREKHFTAQREPHLATKHKGRQCGRLCSPKIQSQWQSAEV
jgi:hypothetical protein